MWSLSLFVLVLACYLFRCPRYKITWWPLSQKEGSPWTMGEDRNSEKSSPKLFHFVQKWERKIENFARYAHKTYIPLLLLLCWTITVQVELVVLVWWTFNNRMVNKCMEVLTKSLEEAYHAWEDTSYPLLQLHSMPQTFKTWELTPCLLVEHPFVAM